MKDTPDEKHHFHSLNGLKLVHVERWTWKNPPRPWYLTPTPYWCAVFILNLVTLYIVLI